LFTLSSIQNATLALLAQSQNSSLLEQIEIAICFWNKVSDCIPDWNAVLRREKSAGEIRKDYVHCHAVMLTVLGHLGAALLSTFPDDWEVKLDGLKQVDWSRSNPEWQGKIIIEKRIIRSLESITLTTVYLKKQLQLTLTPEEKALG
jgi:DNA sulfur modification protein DndB